MDKDNYMKISYQQIDSGACGKIYHLSIVKVKVIFVSNIKEKGYYISVPRLLDTDGSWNDGLISWF